MSTNYCFGCMEKISAYPCPKCGYTPSQRMFPYALTPGTILNDKYLIGNVLGQGGFGITYIGMDLQLQRRVAIKEYYPTGFVGRKGSTGSVIWYSGEASQEARRSGQEIVLKEARKMSRIGDIPEIVKVFDVFQSNETAYICMDFIQGRTLQAQLKKTGPLPWESAKTIFLPVIRAMEQVHQQGLIHRDLSPDNLMILPSGGIRILDLGAAKDLKLNSGKSSMMVAKNGFSPLEQYGQTGNSGPWTDVYALAATIYYTLTGVLPPSALERIDRDSLRWDLPQLQVLPPEVLSALKNALAVRSGSRTQSMSAFLQELQGKAPAAKRSGTGKEKEQHRDTKKWLIPAAAALVAAAVVAVGALGILSGKKDGKPAKPDSPKTAQKEAAAAPGTDWSARMAELKANCVKEVFDYENGTRMEIYFDQQDQECLRIYLNENGREEFAFAAEYDKDGNILEQLGFENGEPVRRTLWVRNKAGKSTEITTWLADDLLEKTEIVYDSQDREVSRTTVDGSGTVTLEATSTYDSQGRETYSGTRRNGERFLSTYDADGNILESITRKPDGSQLYRFTYQHDADGKEISYSYYDEDNQLSSRTDYHFDGDLEIGYTSYSYYNNTENITEYTYILGPRNIRFGDINHDPDYGSRMERVQSISGGWTLRYFRYNNSTSSYSREAYNVTYYNWMLETVRSAGFDKDGNPTSTSETLFDEAGQQTGTRYCYLNEDGSYSVSMSDNDYNTLYREEYDSNDTLLSKTEYLFDAHGESAGSIRTVYNEDGSYTESESNASYRTTASRTYDSSGTLISTAEYSYNADGTRSGSVLTTYYYDGSYTVTIKDGNSRTVSERTYDADGNPIS